MQTQSMHEPVRLGTTARRLALLTAASSLTAAVLVSGCFLSIDENGLVGDPPQRLVDSNIVMADASAIGDDASADARDCWIRDSRGDLEEGCDETITVTKHAIPEVTDITALGALDWASYFGVNGDVKDTRDSRISDFTLLFGGGNFRNNEPMSLYYRWSDGAIAKSYGPSMPPKAGWWEVNAGAGIQISIRLPVGPSTVTFDGDADNAFLVASFGEGAVRSAKTEGAGNQRFEMIAHTCAADRVMKIALVSNIGYPAGGDPHLAAYMIAIH